MVYDQLTVWSYEYREQESQSRGSPTPIQGASFFDTCRCIQIPSSYRRTEGKPGWSSTKWCWSSIRLEAHQKSAWLISGLFGRPSRLLCDPQPYLQTNDQLPNHDFPRKGRDSRRNRKSSV